RYRCHRMEWSNFNPLILLSVLCVRSDGQAACMHGKSRAEPSLTSARPRSITQLGGIVHAGVACTPAHENGHRGYVRGNVDVLTGEHRQAFFLLGIGCYSRRALLRHPVTVDRRIAPPTAAPERRVRLSPHAAPQCPEACHAYLAGETRAAPAFSHRGSVHAALADYSRAHCVDPR